MCEEVKKLYRISTDAQGDYVRLYLESFRIVKHTPKGYWIGTDYMIEGYGFDKSGEYQGSKKWVSKVSRKRYAYPTKDEALRAYIMRTARYASILQARLDHALGGLKLGNRLKKEEIEINDDNLRDEREYVSSFNKQFEEAFSL